MGKRVIIHDLSEQQFDSLGLAGPDTSVIRADGRYAPCQGCFGCWVKTPGKCVLKDSLQKVGAMLGNAEEVMIISENCYGGYSENIKNVIDRSIANSLPFFTLRHWQLHHVSRYPAYKTALTVYFYGDMTAREKETARKLVKAHGINMAAKSAKAVCVSDYGQINKKEEESQCAL